MSGTKASLVTRTNTLLVGKLISTGYVSVTNAIALFFPFNETNLSVIQYSSPNSLHMPLARIPAVLLYFLSKFCNQENQIL